METTFSRAQLLPVEVIKPTSTDLDSRSTDVLRIPATLNTFF